MDYQSDDIAITNIDAQTVFSLTDFNSRFTNIQNYINGTRTKVNNLSSNKVDKVTNYGLSKNDFTDIYKSTLDNLSTTLNNYVLKDGNKVLSDNNFTNDLLNKLNNIESNAQVNTVTGVKGDSETTYRTGQINITKTNIGLGNVANSTYAGGTAVTLNGTSKAASTASFYAPTSAGTSGYVLKSNGSGAPTWSYLPQYSSLSFSSSYPSTSEVKCVFSTNDYTKYSHFGFQFYDATTQMYFYCSFLNNVGTGLSYTNMLNGLTTALPNFEDTTTNGMYVKIKFEPSDKVIKFKFLDLNRNVLNSSRMKYFSLYGFIH